jgi:restriction endonuclease Mrr
LPDDTPKLAAKVPPVATSRPEPRHLEVPEYQTFMAPVVRALQDGRPRPIKEIRETVADEIGITDDDRSKVVRWANPTKIN